MRIIYTVTRKTVSEEAKKDKGRSWSMGSGMVQAKDPNAYWLKPGYDKK